VHGTRPGQLKRAKTLQREVIELKLRRQGKGNPLEEALVQIDGYLDQLGLDRGTLILFGRRGTVLEKRRAPVITGTTALSGGTSRC
jgi:hypothetical protein